MKGLRVEGNYYGTKVAGIVTETRMRGDTQILYVELETPIRNFLGKLMTGCILDINKVTRISG